VSVATRRRLCLDLVILHWRNDYLASTTLPRENGTFHRGQLGSVDGRCAYRPDPSPMCLSMQQAFLVQLGHQHPPMHREGHST